MLTTLLIVSILFVAFTNGANANFKGVASLYASRTTTLSQALYWGTFTTFLGCLTSVFLSHGLLKQFSGRALVPNDLVQSPVFACAVALGAALTSFLATRLAFPVSTTHALLGALVGAGLAADPTKVNITPLLGNFLVPLFFSPFIAMAISIPIAILVGRDLPESQTTRKSVNIVHFVSAGGASFARGLNDAPKMAALFLVLPNANVYLAIFAVAIMIMIGGLVDAKRVAETLGSKVANMSATQGMISSLVTFGLVTTASFKSIPVSTTHVSVGALLGSGIVSKQANWKKVIEIFFAWISTVPCGAILAALSYLIISRLFN